MANGSGATPWVEKGGEPWVRLAHPLADLVVGQSGTDLFLRDGPRPLLLRMATDEPFRGALRAFRSRIAFANRGGDFMVPYGSAAIDVTAHWLPGVADPFVEWVGSTSGAATQLPTGVMMLETYSQGRIGQMCHMNHIQPRKSPQI